MSSPNLYFNILTFNYPSEKKYLYFSEAECGSCTRIHKSIFPKNIEYLYPGIIKDGVEHIYTTFDYAKKDFLPLSIDVSSENPDFIKKYYSNKLYYYFKKELKLITKRGFIGETIVWLPSADQSAKFNIYEKFSLQIKLNTVSNFPELQLSFNGKARVYKCNVANLLKSASPKHFKWILQEQSIFDYDKMKDFDEPDYKTAFPIMNNKLRKELNLPYEENKKGNKYKKYWSQIQTFFDDYLYTESFTEIIPLINDNFLQTCPFIIENVEDESNVLAFEDEKPGRIPKLEFLKLKPFRKSPYNKIHLFFIVHRDDTPVALKLKNYFDNGYTHRFPGLYEFVSLPVHTENKFSIVFKNKENPVPEIEAAFTDRIFDDDVRYIAVYVSPFNKSLISDDKKAIYYRIKKILLKRNITSQAVEAHKVLDEKIDYSYSLQNMAVAMLAKLNGIPWRLKRNEQKDLVVGVGAFKNTKQGVQYIGSAIAFDNFGNFNNFECFMNHQTDLLAGCIATKVREFTLKNAPPERLVIHFYKSMSRSELEPIQKKLEALEFPFPITIYIISINKTESKNIVAFDHSQDDLMPASGTYIDIGEHEYLLYNNAKFKGSTVGKTDGHPFPVKLKIDCTDKKKLQDITIIRGLIDQVYQFSRMYWKSLRQQSLPVTIKYPEMVARIASNFEGEDIPSFGKDNLWFL